MAKGALTLDPAASLPGAAAAPPDIHVALRGIAHTYPARADQGPVRALGPLDFDFRRGEFVGVVGPSGCGKSTLLEIIAGLATPSAGTVEMEGARSPARWRKDRRRVPGRCELSWLNVWDNVAFGLRRAGIEPARSRAASITRSPSWD